MGYTTEERLAAALALALHDAHPVYANTTGWRGGVGGQSMTTGCSFIDPPPDADWTQYGLLSVPLREFLDKYPGYDLHLAKRTLREELLEKLYPKVQQNDD